MMPAAEEPSPAVAVDVIRAYYRAIDEQRYRDAYQLWGSDGEASGKSFDAFRSGFTETVSVEVTPGTPGPMEGAAGSRYIDVPVRVAATLRDGTTQSFTGTYTLRRAVVDGATAAQRAWHIASARMMQVK